MIEIEPQQTKWGDKEVQQRIEIWSEAITGSNLDKLDEQGSNPDKHDKQGTYDIMETFAQHHNLDFEQAIPV